MRDAVRRADAILAATKTRRRGRHAIRTTPPSRTRRATTIVATITALALAGGGIVWATGDDPDLIAEATALPTTDRTVVDVRALDLIADLAARGVPTTGHGAHLVQMAERTCHHSQSAVTHETLAPAMKVYFADLHWTDAQALAYVLAAHDYCATLDQTPAQHGGH